jgi:hypothetical protein
MTSADEEKFEQARTLWARGEAGIAALTLDDLASRHPGNAGLFSALGVCRFECADYAGARAALERALALDPDQGVAAYNLAHLLLLLGEEEQGFDLYERRWSSFIRPSWHPSLDLTWDGEDLDGALLVLAEQGFGDMIQFARFLPLAARKCKRLALVVPSELKRLLAGMSGVDSVITAGDALPAFDRFVMLQSLPHRLKAFGRHRPLPPYLSVPDPLVLPGGGLKVGLVWAGRPAHAQDRLRSMPPEALAPLLGVPGVNFFSLQWGQPSPWPDVPDLTAGIKDFQDTARILSGLDLLISVDSAPAHLAGALGKPVFTFVTHVPDWRWGLAGEGSSWYPSMRLFRQEAPGDWSGAVQKADLALRSMTHPNG